MFMFIVLTKFRSLFMKFWYKGYLVRLFIVIYVRDKWESEIWNWSIQKKECLLLEKYNVFKRCFVFLLEKNIFLWKIFQKKKFPFSLTSCFVHFNG